MKNIYAVFYRGRLMHDTETSVSERAAMRKLVKITGLNHERLRAIGMYTDIVK